MVGANGTATPPVAWRPPSGSKASGAKPETNYPPPSQRLSKLEAARQQAADALVLSERQRAAEVSENAAWLTHLDDEIYRATTQLHASYKGEYTVTLTHAGPTGFGMTLETGKDGVTRVMAVARHGSAAAGGVVVGSEVIAVAGCTLERGQGQDGLIPLTAICGVSSVDFRFRRPNAAAKTAIWREFDEYAAMRPGEVLLTVEYSAGHLHARYEWAAAQVREAVAAAFPGIRVLPKPLDTHAPKHRQRIGAFELQLAWLSVVADPHGRRLSRSLIFSKLQTNLFPHLPRLLAKLRELEEQGCWSPFVPTVQPAVGISRAPPAMACDEPISALGRPDNARTPAPASGPAPPALEEPALDEIDYSNDDDILEVSNGSTRERRRSLDPFEDLN